MSTLSRKAVSATVCALVLLTTIPRTAATQDLQLAFEDDFERREPGDHWRCLLGAIRIVDGELELSGARDAILMCMKPFGKDVKVEYDAYVVEGEHLCELSPLLCANGFFGDHTGYLISYGGAHNKLIAVERWGKNIKGFEASPLAPGKKSRFQASSIDGRICLCVDGKEVISVEDKEPVGGPFLDKIGFMTHMSRIRIDNVRVYSAEPPEQPRADAGPLTTPQALEQLAGEPPSLDNALRIAVKVGDLEFTEDAKALDAILKMLDHPQCAGDRAGIEKLRGETQLMARVVRPGYGRDKIRATLEMLSQMRPDHPFRDRAVLSLIRAAYWRGRESGSGHMIEGSRHWAEELRKRWPENEVVRLYCGEHLPWGEEEFKPDERAPLWANQLREVYGRMIAVIEWWGQHRQAPDGQLGGGWADDCEILRTWAPAIFVSDASSQAAHTMKRLCDGIWDSEQIKGGYASYVSDVEHSAEPTSDTQPLMLMLEYGNEVYVERNLQTAGLLREVFTGKNDRGFRQFKSNHIGAGKVRDDPRHAADVPYANRAMKPLAWLIWAGDFPAERKLLAEWADTWREAAMREESGKPKGVVPAAIWWPDGGFRRKLATWYDPKLGWDYYLWGTGCQQRILSLMVTAYRATGDAKYLDPVWETYRIVASPAEEGEHAQYSPEWARNYLRRKFRQRIADLLALVPELLDAEMEDFVAKSASPYVRFRNGADVSILEQGLAKCLEGLRLDFAMKTSEVTATDRLYIPGSGDVYCLYTGALGLWGDIGIPDHRVTWRTGTRNFAALVTHADPEELRVKLYSFEEKPIWITARLWQMKPGLLSFKLTNDDGEVLTKGRFELKQRATGPTFNLPPGTVVTLSVRLET